MVNAQHLRGEATAQVSKGWLAPPQLLGRGGNLPGWRPNASNVAFRFGVKQDAKLRACDDLKHSLTNQPMPSSQDAYPAGILGSPGAAAQALC